MTYINRQLVFHGSSCDPLNFHTILLHHNPDYVCMNAKSDLVKVVLNTRTK